jgi:hypothetical protein
MHSSKLIFLGLALFSLSAFADQAQNPAYFFGEPGPNGSWTVPKDSDFEEDDAGVDYFRVMNILMAPMNGQTVTGKLSSGGACEMKPIAYSLEPMFSLETKGAKGAPRAIYHLQYTANGITKDYYVNRAGDNGDYNFYVDATTLANPPLDAGGDDTAALVLSRAELAQYDDTLSCNLAGNNLICQASVPKSFGHFFGKSAAPDNCALDISKANPPAVVHVPPANNGLAN